MDNTADTQHRRLSILQVGGLAGPGAAAGGVWAVARTQRAALAGLGETVELVGGWLGRVPKTDNTANGEDPVTLFRVRRPFPGARLRGLVSLRLPRYVAARAASSDVVQVHLCRDFITTAATVLLSRGNTPVIAQSHGMLVPSRSLPVRIYDTAITRWLVRIPRLWLTLTEDEERGLQQLGVDSVRMRRVVNATVASDHMWSDPEQQVFLFAARLAPRKQPAVFVQAALEALDRGLDAHFILAGPDQGEAARVRAMIAASAHAERFEVSGELTPAQVQSAMAACTAYVLPALNEPYPMSVIEAAAAGTPLIVTSECGLADDLYEGDAAVLAEPTADAFCRAMLNVGADPDRRIELGANARRVHQRLWSAERLAEELRKLCLEALEETAGSSWETIKPAEPVQQNGGRL
ncbi:glycosyltransferase family 4 protein [Arthrobacter zhaoxinii]|uniref:Glycosyltransferase family 4 protein n=1 Tax=Arthrobacter zhaoxinii TaxID=2964616 RepID=A0ABY5YS84_9MICC|nr:glycosyltransferase family 4 protein [Arthrobacter zhaoxinii]UWX97971.1 glycosyltransferase family 4 protein [Arthrobacter zhaoxinii]